MESKKSGIMTSGATCVSALLHCTRNEGEGESASKQLYIANAGDSRAVLCSSADEEAGYASVCVQVVAYWAVHMCYFIYYTYMLRTLC